MQPSWQRSSLYFHGLCWLIWLGSGGEVFGMTHEANSEMDSIPLRVNELERGQSLHDHRLKQLEVEKLPHRVGNLEGSVAHLLEVAQDAKATRDAVTSLTSYVKGMAKVLTVLFAVLTLVIAAVGLVPKFDAMIIDKNPPVQQR